MDAAKHWKPEPIMELLTWLFASMLAGSILIAWLPKMAGAGVTAQAPEIRFVAHLVGAITFHGMLIWLAVRFVRGQSTSWNEAFGFGKASARSVLLWSLLAVMVSLPASWVLGQCSSLLMTSAHLEPELQQAVKTLQQTRGVSEKIVFGFSAILLAPIAEELLFRGILYPALRALGFRKCALWGSSLLFAAVHANLVTFLSLTFFALVLAWLYEQTQDLRAPIAAHGLFNAVNFLWLLNAPS